MKEITFFFSGQLGLHIQAIPAVLPMREAIGFTPASLLAFSFRSHGT
jgi:hypothetical protein